MTTPLAPVRPLLLIAVVCGLAVAEEPSSLVTNPSFESAQKNLPTGWRANPAVYSLDSALAHTDKSSLKYSNTDPRRYTLASQKLAVQPNWKVRLSAWVRTRNLAGSESGATICMEWQDQAGKWLGGCYPHGVKGNHDWTRIEAVARIPVNAGNVNISCYVRPGMTGEAWFDDVEVVRVFDPPMTSTVLLPNYRGRLFPGEPITARVRLNLTDHPVKADELQIEAALVSADNKPLARTTARPATAAEPTDLRIPTKDLPPGEATLVVRLLNPAGQEMQSERHALTLLATGTKFKSEIDSHGRLLIEGKPFFPLGMYWSGIKEADLKVYGQSKFNCIMPYQPPTREQLDLAQQHGIKVIYSIKDWYFGLKTCPKFIRSADDEEARIRQRVQQMRDHPALLAWYLNDELGQEYMPRLEAHQRWLREEDPHHPTWVVLYQVDQVRSYLKTFDIIGTDPYPIGKKPASLAGQWTMRTFDQAEKSRPMWQVPQVFNWANYAKNESDKSRGRTPTPEEMRSMAWQCIAEGATGLIFYSWYDIRRNPDVPFERQWEAIKTIAAEIDRHAPALLNFELTPAIALEGQRPAWLHWIARRAPDGKMFLFAVNDGDGEGSIAFKFPPFAKSARELSENQDVPIRDTILRDESPRLSVRIYEITLN